jgi:hypothetical protein
MAFKYALCPFSEKLTVILITIWWLQRLQITQKFGMNRFDLKKLNDAYVGGKYQIKFSNRSRACEKLQQ